MLSWNVAPRPPDIIGPWFLWKIIIDQRHQGRGYGADATRRVAEESPSDHHGHGTSVGELVRCVAGGAEVHSYRIMEEDERYAESTSLLAALIETVARSGTYQVVAVPQRAEIPDRNQGQVDLLGRLLDHQRRSGTVMPVVVCAAGNRGPGAETMSYAAITQGTVVALGCGWTGVPAGYNCDVPGGSKVFTVTAPGRLSKQDPVGALRESGAAMEEIYGTSYATAVTAGRLVVWP